MGSCARIWEKSIVKSGWKIVHRNNDRWLRSGNGVREEMLMDEIRQVKKTDIKDCVNIIRKSFMTVAEEFGFTEENAPRFTAFATTEKRLIWHFEGEKRSMFVYCQNERMVGYYSLLKQDDKECELNNLCVLPECRHNNIGKRLLEHAFSEAQKMGCSEINIGIVEENVRLREWYEASGAEHIGTKKFDFFPFTCGYMRKKL